MFGCPPGLPGLLSVSSGAQLQGRGPLHLHLAASTLRGLLVVGAWAWLGFVLAPRSGAGAGSGGLCVYVYVVIAMSAHLYLWVQTLLRFPITDTDKGLRS